MCLPHWSSKIGVEQGLTRIGLKQPLKRLTISDKGTPPPPLCEMRSKSEGAQDKNGQQPSHGGHQITSYFRELQNIIIM